LPASNQKLLTTAAALDLLGAEYRYSTRLLTKEADPKAGVVHGDVYLKGSGDPFLGEADLDDIVRQTRSRGITRVVGRVVGDGSCFSGPKYGCGWSWDDMSYRYSAPVTGLNLNHNVVTISVLPSKKIGSPAVVRVTPSNSVVRIINRTLTVADTETALRVERTLGRNTIEVEGHVPVGAPADTRAAVEVTVEDPPLYAAQRLTDKLRAAGISVTRAASQGSAPATCAFIIAEHNGQPMSQLIALINKPSDNLGAECLLRTIGLERRGKGTDVAGIEAVVEWLQSLGVQRNGVIMRDGSGLSRMNYVTARTIATVLRSMRTRPTSDAWLASLPIGGMDGTLRNRFRGTPAEGKVQAKTGYVSNVSALSGYVTTQSGSRLLFVMLMNNHPCSNAEATEVLDHIVGLLVQYAGSNAVEQAGPVRTLDDSRTLRLSRACGRQLVLQGSAPAPAPRRD